MSKRKICIFCETWESGGIESFLTNVLLRLDMQFFSVDIVVASLKDSVFTQSLEQMGVQFRELSGSTRNLNRNLKMFRQLLGAQHYDVLHLNIYQALSMCYMHEAKKAGVPVRIIHSHNTALRKSKLRVLKLIIHSFAKQCLTTAGTCFLACSSEAAKFMFPKKLIYDRKYDIVPNGIDIERFRFNSEKRYHLRRRLGLQGEFIVGNIGRLCYQKNQDFLLDVFSVIQNRIINSKLLLVGTGEDEQVLRQKAQRLGISDDVIFFGMTPKPEELMWIMDAFAFPSRFEGLSLVVVEAQASGLPIICSEALPSEAFLTNEMQKLSLSTGKKAWADALVNCKIHEDREQAAEQVRHAGFDMKNVSKQIATYYLEG